MTQQAQQVWDIGVRTFHWTLVTAFTVAYLTGEGDSQWHVYAGYVIGGLLVFRIIWGFVGTRYARFSHFIYSPKETIDYIKSLAGGTPKHYMGHNPAGALMIFVMLVTLVLTTLSGLKVYGLEGYGPLADSDTGYVIRTAQASGGMVLEREDDEGEEDEAEEFWEEIHEALANFMLILIFIHLAGVVISSRAHRENLVKAMITGKKDIREAN